MKSLLNFKDSYIMHVNNGYRFGKEEAPIMSFQTNKDGIFAPVITPLSGVLKWVVDGVEQITNSPSYSLTGATVNVKVFANTVNELEAVNVSMASFDIIGILDFSYFIIQGLFDIQSNPSLTDVYFNNQSHSCSEFRTGGTSIASLDLSSFTLSGVFNVNDNSSLTSIVFSGSGNSSTQFRARSTSLASLDLSSFALSGGLWLYDNSSLTSIIFSGSGNSSNDLKIYSTSLTSLDLSSFTLSGVFNVNDNSSLTSIVFSGSGNSSNDFNAQQCASLASLDLSSFTLSGGLNLNFSDLSQSLIFSNSGNLSNNINISVTNVATLDLSSFTFSSQLRINGNSSLISLNFGNNAHTLSICRMQSNSLITSLDLSNITISGDVWGYGCNISSIVLPIYTTGLSDFDFNNNSLTQIEVDSIFNSLNTFFSLNTPIKSISIDLSGGINSSPTDGASNTDIQNLITLFSNAGFTFNYQIN